MIKLAGPATTWPYVVVIVISVAIAIIGFFLVVHGLMAKGNRTFVVGMVAVALGLLSLAVWGSILNEVDSSDLKHRKLLLWNNSCITATLISITTSSQRQITVRMFMAALLMLAMTCTLSLSTPNLTLPLPQKAKIPLSAAVERWGFCF